MIGGRRRDEIMNINVSSGSSTTDIGPDGRQRDGGSLTLLVSSEFIKGTGVRAAKVEYTVMPLVVCRDGTVQNGWLPNNVGCHDDVWQRLELCICVGTALEISESVNNVDRESISIGSGNTLRSSDLHRALVYIKLMVFKLVARMNSPSQGHPSVLVEDTNDRPSLRLQVCPGCDDVQICDLVVIESTNTDLTVWVDGDDAHIVSGEATVSTTVDECTKRTGSVRGADGVSPLGMVGQSMHVVLAHLSTLSRLKLSEELLKRG
jgi:hypothetical protein